MSDSFWPFVASFSVGLASIAVGVYLALNPQRQLQINQFFRRSLGSQPQFSAAVLGNSGGCLSTSYTTGLQRQLEHTNTLRRVMAKTAHCPGNSVAARGKLQKVLELRQAILSAELRAQEGITDENAQPDWKALQKAYDRIITLQKIQVELKAAPEADSSPKSHQSKPQSPQKEASTAHSLAEVNQTMAKLNQDLQHKVNILAASDERVKLLEAKLNLAQAQIARMQAKLNDTKPSYLTPHLLSRVN